MFRCDLLDGGMLLGETKRKSNEVIKFLEGTWITKDVTIAPDQEVKIREYREIMKMKDPETITITARGIDKEKDVTRDITFRIDGDKVIMSQGDFSARGTRKGNMISLEGRLQDYSFDFRLYLLADKYVYQKDVWKNSKVIESQMSYLVRSNK
jgi:hypothetical protein